MSSWTSVAAQATQINFSHVTAQPLDMKMTTFGSPDPCSWTMIFNMVQRQQQRPQLWLNHGHRHSPRQQPRPECHPGPSWQTGCWHRPIPHHCLLPQYMDHSSSLCLPFLYHMLAHYNDTHSESSCLHAVWTMMTQAVSWYQAGLWIIRQTSQQNTLYWKFMHVWGVYFWLWVSHWEGL